MLHIVTDWYLENFLGSHNLPLWNIVIMIFPLIIAPSWRSFCDIICRFDSLRVTPRLLDTLATGPEICGDLAVELALAGPQFTQVVVRHQGSKFSLCILFLELFPKLWQYVGLAMSLCCACTPFQKSLINFGRWVPAFTRLSSVSSNIKTLPTFQGAWSCLHQVCMHCLNGMDAIQHVHCNLRLIITLYILICWNF